MISVILPVLDGLPWLEEQLAALAAQACDEPWEVVVADNGSTDGSAGAVARWVGDGYPFRLVDASGRRGPAAARNAGARAAAGAHLAFCDADDVVAPGWLRAVTAPLAGADVVAGCFDMAALNGLSPGEPSPAATSQLGFLPAGLAANLAVRRDVFEEAGGFSEDLVVGEDVDLCWRLQLDGRRFVVARDAVVAKRQPRELRRIFATALAYGRCGPALYRRYRSRGAQRDLRGWVRAAGWLLLSVPRLGDEALRRRWVRAAGMRIGRLLGSIEQRAFFP